MAHFNKETAVTELTLTTNAVEPTWRIPVTLSDMKLRADNIGGEIKQADANIIEAKRTTENALKALRLAEAAETKAIAAAADKRHERDALAQALYAYTLGLGEVAPPMPAPTLKPLDGGFLIADKPVSF